MSQNATFWFPPTGRVIAQVPFLFGIAGRPELGGLALQLLLGDLGMSPPAARTLIARMRRDGLLASKKSGRRALYHLAGAFAGAFERARRPALITPVTWQGSFHAVIYQVPERHRAFRDALRRTAMLSGLGLLQPGLLLALRDPRATLEPVLAVKPPPARVLFTSIAMELEDARGAARTAWALPDLEAVYAGHIKCLRAALSRERAAPAATAETLRRFNRLARDPMSDMLRDPGLPPELLPAAWTGPRLRDALAEVTARFYPPAHTFVVERITSVS